MTPHTHTHPGEILREDVFPELGLSVTEAATHLRMTRTALSRVLNGHAGISPALALRLEKAGISNADFWVRFQASYDLWQARRRPQPDIQRFAAA
ncbi:hypothetical protein CGLAMM_02740 [Acetobacteraceae bacterium EV16G]|uniref:HTH cro/C1-type domain-containing protein n=1 Tax=Sorlinia euscelidii TaxID=3081148 RepID=A0ABU7U373_9PROT